ncbi:hypothetical protein [Oscillatoria salina]|uniref:hypothetical protein n=1 Tax=Oscillatoria salina TaxID=331517 RepID=UPI0013B75F66|nr:hypothetical protein [Oscillatoria salina]MBZ8182748.1 hypothetical protein [Oscillatoria salina IIICB1]NET91444.1 hypothetical protein [Kamptonema sp. SIO1D9]
MRGTEIRALGGAPKSMISFTTDPNVVSTFYTPDKGRILTRREVPYNLLIPQTLETSTESEVLVLHMIKKARIQY